MGMRVTENNAKAAVEIMRVLEENKCTVADVTGILNYVEMKIRNATMVQKQDYSSILKELTASSD